MAIHITSYIQHYNGKTSILRKAEDKEWSDPFQRARRWGFRSTSCHVFTFCTGPCANLTFDA